MPLELVASVAGSNVAASNVAGPQQVRNWEEIKKDRYEAATAAATAS